MYIPGFCAHAHTWNLRLNEVQTMGIILNNSQIRCEEVERFLPQMWPIPINSVTGAAERVNGAGVWAANYWPRHILTCKSVFKVSVGCFFVIVCVLTWDRMEPLFSIYAFYRLVNKHTPLEDSESVCCRQADSCWNNLRRKREKWGNGCLFVSFITYKLAETETRNHL